MAAEANANGGARTPGQRPDSPAPGHGGQAKDVGGGERRGPEERRDLRGRRGSGEHPDLGERGGSEERRDLGDGRGSEELGESVRGSGERLAPGGTGPRDARDGEARTAPASRRFPRVTRDTARPQGGGRAASGHAPAPVRQWPLLSVLGGTAVGLAVVAADFARVGILIVGLALLAGAVMRWSLPSVGMLAVRSRFTDVVIYGVLGAVILLLALMAQPDPWLDLPWLEDLVHFTVR
ncbi:DUF3017 domain-containing protein [Streptomyces pathocidini]